MKKYRRNRAKDVVMVAIWTIAFIPILPLAIILLIHDPIEKVANWYDGLFLQAIRNYRNKWNPIKEEE